jgi:hypothetical protein
MSSVGYDPAAPGAELERRGIRLGDVLFQGIAVAASVAATALLGLIAYQVLRRMAGDPAVRPRVRLDRGLGSGQGHVTAR